MADAEGVEPDVPLTAPPASEAEARTFPVARARPKSLAGRLGEPVLAASCATVQPAVLVAGLLVPGSAAAVGELCVLPVAAAAWLLSPGFTVAVTATAVVVRVLAAALGQLRWSEAGTQVLLLALVAAAVQLAARRSVGPATGETGERRWATRVPRGANPEGGVPPQERVRELSFLLDTAQRLSLSLESAVILQHAVEAVALGISRPGAGRPAHAAYHQVEGDSLRVTTVTGGDAGAEGFAYPLARNQGAVGAARTGHAALVRPDHMTGSLRAYVDGLDLKVLAVAPVHVGGALDGHLVASARDHGAVDRHQLRMLEVIAHLAGLALVNAEHLRRERLHAERMESLEKVKSEILNLVSHELRTPLTVALGYVTMLQEGSIGSMDEGSRAALPVVAAKLGEMEGLVQQMLEASRLEEGRLALRLERLDLREVAEEAVEASAPLGGPGHRLRVQVPPDPVLVQADRDRVATILGNLLGNAIKYSPDGGGIRCAVTTAGGQARVAVSDAGLGIAPEDLPRLFSRFGRVMTPETSGISGTGLGLYLSRQLARQHGGDVTVRSQAGRGSTFTLTLPLVE